MSRVKIYFKIIVSKFQRVIHIRKRQNDSFTEFGIHTTQVKVPSLKYRVSIIVLPLQ